MKKLLGMIVAMLAVLSASVLGADYAIQNVYMNGYQISGNTVQVELGQPITLDIAVYGYSNKDVRLRAWIGGYEYDVIEDSSEMFDVENGIVVYKKLKLDVPEDMVSSKTYTLNIQLFDSQNRVERTYNLYVEEKRHNIVVQDVLLRPGSSLEAGETLFANVRLENMGEKKEEDIRIDMLVEGLSVSTRVYLDELNKYMQDENSANTPSLVLTIPENAPTGDYKVKLAVNYNRGHSETVEEFMIHVDGLSADEIKKTDSLVSVQTATKMQLGQESVVKVMVANLGKRTEVYSLESNGLSWAQSSLSQFVSVAPGQTGEFLVKVTPIEAGNHAFSVKVREDGSLVKEASFNVEVAELKESNGKLLWVVAGIVMLAIIVAVVASSMFGEKVERHELH